MNKRDLVFFIVLGKLVVIYFLYSGSLIFIGLNHMTHRTWLDGLIMFVIVLGVCVYVLQYRIITV